MILNSPGWKNRQFEVIPLSKNEKKKERRRRQKEQE
jgi:hypothetical protein